MSLDPEILRRAADAALEYQHETEKRQMLKHPDMIAAQRFLGRACHALRTEFSEVPRKSKSRRKSKRQD